MRFAQKLISVVFASLILLSGTSAQENADLIILPDQGLTIDIYKAESDTSYILFRKSQGGGIATYSIEKFDGISYITIKQFDVATSGAEAVQPHCILYDKEKIYLGGSFTSFKGVAGTAGVVMLSDGNWVSAGGGLNTDTSLCSTPTVYDLALYDNRIVAGGNFSLIGATPFHPLAVYNGSGWESFGSSLLNNSCWVATTVQKLKADGSKLYVAGHFSKSGAKSLINVALWQGNDWVALGGGLPDTPLNSIFAMEIHNNGLYISHISGSSAQVSGYNLDGYSPWQSILSAQAGECYYSLQSYSNRLFIGGYFNHNGHYGLMSWDGMLFKGYNVNENSYVYGMFTFNENIFFNGTVNISGQYGHTAILTVVASADENTPVEHAGMQVFPNPSKGSVNILMPVDFDVQGAVINIYNLSGQLKFSRDASFSVPLNLDELTAGAYLLEVRNNSRAFHTRLLITK
jgi:hypothetical protein